MWQNHYTTVGLKTQEADFPLEELYQTGYRREGAGWHQEGKTRETLFAAGQRRGFDTS
jgi:hypothetical protein